jgi:hypothetical protein
MGYQWLWIHFGEKRQEVATGLLARPWPGEMKVVVHE